MTIQRTDLPEVLNASAIRGADVSGYTRMAQTFAQGGQVFSNLADLSYKRTMMKYENQGAKDGRSAVTINPVTSVPEVNDVSMVDPETMYGQKFFQSLESTSSLALENSITIKSSEIQKKYPLEPEKALEEMQAYTRGITSNMPEQIRPQLEQTSAIMQSRMYGDINRNVIERSQQQAMVTNMDVLNTSLAQMTNLNEEGKSNTEEYLNFQRQADAAFENLQNNIHMDLSVLDTHRKNFNKNVYLSQWQGKINAKYGTGNVQGILDAHAEADKFREEDNELFTSEERETKYREFKNRINARINDQKAQANAVDNATKQWQREEVLKLQEQYAGDYAGYREELAQRGDLGKASDDAAKSIIDQNITFMETAKNIGTPLKDRVNFIINSSEQMRAIEVAHPDLYTEVNNYKKKMAEFMLEAKQDENLINVWDAAADNGAIDESIPLQKYIDRFGDKKGTELFKRNQKNLNKNSASTINKYKGDQYTKKGIKWDKASADENEKAAGHFTDIGAQMNEVWSRSNMYGRLAPSAGLIFETAFEDPRNLDYNVVADMMQLRSLLIQGKHNPETGEYEKKHNRSKIDGWFKPYLKGQDAQGLYDYLTRRIVFPKDQNELNDAINQYFKAHSKIDTSTTPGRLNMAEQQKAIDHNLNKVAADLDHGLGDIGHARGIAQATSGFAFRGLTRKAYSDELIQLWNISREDNPLTSRQDRFPVFDLYAKYRTQWDPASKERIMQEIRDRVPFYARKTSESVNEATEDVLQELLDAGRIGTQKVGGRTYMVIDPPEAFANHGEVYRGLDGELRTMADSVPEGDFTYEDMQMHFAGLIRPDATDAELVGLAKRLLITTESDLLAADANGEFGGATFRVREVTYDGHIEERLSNARFNATDTYRYEAWRKASETSRADPEAFADIVQSPAWVSDKLWMEWMKPTRLQKYFQDEMHTKTIMRSQLNKVNKKLIMSGNNPIHVTEEDLDAYIKWGPGISKNLGVFMFNRMLDSHLFTETFSDPNIMRGVGALFGQTTPESIIKARESIYKEFYRQ